MNDNDFDLCYWLDIGDVIVEVSPQWEIFARANGGVGIEPGNVVGRNLLAFVEGDVTRMYVRSLVQSVRLMRRPVCRSYRCDSPDTRRLMEMRISIENSGLLRWEHRVLHTEPLARRLAFKVQPGAVAARRFVVRCSICNRLKAPGGWCEPDQADASEGPDETIPVIYGVCPDCLSGRPPRSLSG